MAYCDYLFKRSNGIFYFRHVVKLDGQKSREIRVSLKTRSYIDAKPVAAYFAANLKYFLSDGKLLKMNADDLLKELKTLFLNGIDLNNHEHVLRINKAYTNIETKVNWVKEHVPDEFECRSIQEILAVYNKFSSVFNRVKKDADVQNQHISGDEIQAIADSFYGINPQVTSASVSVKVPISELKFLELAQKYSDEMLSGGNWTDKTLHENKATYQLFSELQGNLCVSNIDVKVIASFKFQLQKVPKNFRKLAITKNQTILSVLEKEHQLQTISVSSVNKHLSKISTLLEWGRKNGHCKENPAHGLTIKQKKNSQEDRFPFTEDELGKMFSGELYTPPTYRHSYYFWLPLLGLYTGARINELCQLDVADIKEVDQIKYIEINDLGDKHLKNVSAKREIPIHSKLIAIGFFDFIEQVRKSGSGKVFSSIKKQRDGYGTAPSKWFGRVKKKWN